MFALNVIPPITPYWLTMSHIIPFPHSHIIYNCLVVQIFLFFAHIQLQIVLKGRNYHPLLENLDFSGTEAPLDLRPVCKFKFVRCGPGEKNQSALSFLVEAWRPDETREHHFPQNLISKSKFFSSLTLIIPGGGGAIIIPLKFLKIHIGPPHFNRER